MDPWRCLPTSSYNIRVWQTMPQRPSIILARNRGPYMTGHGERPTCPCPTRTKSEFQKTQQRNDLSLYNIVSDDVGSGAKDVAVCQTATIQYTVPSCLNLYHVHSQRTCRVTQPIARGLYPLCLLFFVSVYWASMPTMLPFAKLQQCTALYQTINVRTVVITNCTCGRTVSEYVVLCISGTGCFACNTVSQLHIRYFACKIVTNGSVQTGSCLPTSRVGSKLGNRRTTGTPSSLLPQVPIAPR